MWYVERLNIPHFRSVYMRDSNHILKGKPWKLESGIINLDDKNSIGSHWACYKSINKDIILYFNSYGDLRPPKELVKYFHDRIILYNTKSYQNDESPPICGHLCLAFLANKKLGFLDDNDIPNNNSHIK